MTLGELLKHEIKRKGFTQKEVAILIGISETALSQIIKGVFPRKTTLDKIQEILQIEIKFTSIDKPR